MASGTFTGTGTSTPVAGMKFKLVLDFAGTASVDLEEQLPDGSAWIKVATGITADYSQNYETSQMTTLRWNCTAHTNNVGWFMDRL